MQLLNVILNIFLYFPAPWFFIWIWFLANILNKKENMENRDNKC